ncbi:phage virion morphogenesis protein [Janthinobacterium sp. BJB1]|nr:phage virion morphogenesis protein [Janthinobacterium sp. BJB1]
MAGRSGTAVRHTVPGSHPAPSGGTRGPCRTGGAAYPARKRRKEFKGKNGRIKRQKAAMFAKIRTAKHLKVKATGDQIEVGFFGWVARVAHVHQFGRQDRVSKKGPAYKYPERPLLGLSEPDRTLIRESLLRHMEKN